MTLKIFTMSNSNWQPRVGQEVVCLKTVGCYIKDERYIVGGIYVCKCGEVYIGAKGFECDYDNFSCDLDHDGVFKTGFYYRCLASKFFAPIHYSDITADLAKQACEERVEVDIKQVERAVNN
jgi:hypothetical protein